MRRLLNLVNKIEPGDFTSYNSLINALANIENMTISKKDHVFYILDRMKREQIKIPAYLFVTVIKACDSDNERQVNALDLWEEIKGKMAEFGQKMHVLIYNSFLSLCLKRDDLETGLEIVRRMKEGEERRPNEDVEFSYINTSQEIRRDVATYNMLIDYCWKKGDMKMAFQMWEEMKKEGIKPDTRTYSSLITSCLRTEKPEKAVPRTFSLLEIMREDNVKPNKILFDAWINELIRIGEVEKSLEVLHIMENEEQITADKSTFLRIWRGNLYM